MKKQKPSSNNKFIYRQNISSQAMDNRTNSPTGGVGVKAKWSPAVETAILASDTDTENPANRIEPSSPAAENVFRKGKKKNIKRQRPPKTKQSPINGPNSIDAQDLSQADSRPSKPRRRKIIPIIAVAICLALLASSAGYFWLDARQRALVDSLLPTSVETAVNLAVPHIPNILAALDFSALAAQETNATLKSMHEYFAQLQPTFTNEYTGMFEGYNFIQIVAEAFSPYLITLEPQLFPNLNRLYNEGFQFTNFYTPFFYHTTSDGEYVTLQSLLPITGRWYDGTAGSYNNSMITSANNYLPQTTAHQLANEEYSLLHAYHNWKYTFYQRNRTHANLGYDYYALGHGLNIPYSWPTSDVDMINATISKVVSAQEPFFVYYLTMSGHGNYNWSGNRMSARHRSEVADLPYPEHVKAYLACNLELDLALGILLDELEKAGLSDRTLISLSADHYPYGINKEATDAMSDLAGRKLDPNFEYFESNWLLWSGSMTQPIVVDTLACNIDMLPTLNNLLGLGWDSRLLVGRDIFSDAERLIIFGSHDWMTDLGRYVSSTREFTPNEGAVIPDGYVEEMTAKVEKQFSISHQILYNDYFRVIYAKSGLM